jgi:hypothetical protein
MEKNEVEALLNKKVAEMRCMLVPHTCFTCGWFILRVEKPHNRACRYPDELKTRGNQCLCWKLEEDAEKRSMGLC